MHKCFVQLISLFFVYAQLNKITGGCETLTLASLLNTANVGTDLVTRL